jgi:hypothetical protein
VSPEAELATEGAPVEIEAEAEHHVEARSALGCEREMVQFWRSLV